MQKVINRGFTLIELLVVIAIIGILASIVLVSLGNARNSGNDAAVKANIDSIRTQMEVFNNNNNTYANGCADATIAAALSAVQTAGGATAINTAYGTAGASGTVTCHTNGATSWAVEAPLRTTGFWCADSRGISATTSASTLGASDAQCN
jgi:prepilin-type N-terminal cleavage/methylation domain-containing protein